MSPGAPQTPRNRPSPGLRVEDWRLHGDEDGPTSPAEQREGERQPNASEVDRGGGLGVGSAGAGLHGDVSSVEPQFVCAASGRLRDDGEPTETHKASFLFILLSSPDILQQVSLSR